MGLVVVSLLHARARFLTHGFPPTLSQDKPYLLPFVEQVLSEHEERHKYDHGHFERASAGSAAGGHH